MRKEVKIIHSLLETIVATVILEVAIECTVNYNNMKT